MKRYAIGERYFVEHLDGGFEIQVVGVSTEQLQSITEHEARLEGLDSIAAFRELWNSIYREPCSWNDNPRIKRVEFERVEGRGLLDCLRLSLVSGAWVLESLAAARHIIK